LPFLLLGQEHFAPTYNLSINDGLLDNNITSILLDQYDDIWLGTDSGVVRYNGVKFENFDLKRAQVLGKVTIFKNSKHQILVSDGVHLFSFDRTTNKFLPIKINSPIHHNPFASGISSIYQPKHKKSLWIATVDKRLFQLNTTTFKIETYKKIVHASQNNIIRSIYLDHNEKLWLGTDNGKLITFHKNEFTLIRSKTFQKSPITAILEDCDQNIWIGTGGKGLFLLDTNGNQVANYNYNPLNNKSLSGNSITSIYEDKFNTLWIATDGNGLSQLIDSKKGFSRYLNGKVIHSIHSGNTNEIWIGTSSNGVFHLDFRNPFFLANLGDSLDKTNLIRSVFRDNSQKLWIGTAGNGVKTYTKSKNINSISYHKQSFNSALSNTSILNIYQDYVNTIWIGSYKKGLFKYNPSKKTTLSVKNIDGHQIHGKEIWAICEDSENRLWIGTNEGLNVFDRKNKTVTYYKNKNTPVTISSNEIRCILKDIKGNMWIGTLNGLNQFNRNTKKIEHYYFDSENLNSISGNTVMAIYEDSNLKLYFGTYINGLNMYSRETNTFKKVKLDEGININSITNIGEDKDNRLLITSKNNLFMIDKQRRKTYNLTNYWGINNLIWARGTLLNDNSGNTLIGSSKGLVFFDSKKNYSIDTSFSFTEIELDKANKKNKISLKSTNTDTIKLNHNQNTFSVKFNYPTYLSKNRKYLYQLKGKSKDWISIESKGRIDLKSLQPGNYILKLKTTKNTLNSNQKKLTIIIDSPVWDKGWFRIIIGLLTFILSLFIWKLRKNHTNKQQNKIDDLISANSLDIKNKMDKKYNPHDLSSLSLKLEHKNQLLELLKKDYKQLIKISNVEHIENLKEKISLINESLLLEKNKDVFYDFFKRTNENFVTTFFQKYKNCTQSEIRLCALVLFEFSNQEIATIMGISYSSVKMKRYRLRKKLKLNTNEELFVFLKQFE